jgi:hypothetical protein
MRSRERSFARRRLQRGQQPAVVRVTLQVAADAELRDVVLVYVGKSAHRVVEIRTCWFVQVVHTIVSIDNPRMAAEVGFADRHVADHELRVVLQLDQLAPRPQRIVLTITGLQLFEFLWMLPEVGRTEQHRVVHVAAGGEPGMQFVQRCHRHRALAVEVPAELAC